MSNRPKAEATMQFEEDRAIATEWRFAPGAETGWHRHEHDYVIVPILDGSLTIETNDGVIETDLKAGQSYFRRAGVEHNVINSSVGEFAFVEIEMPKA